MANPFFKGPFHSKAGNALGNVGALALGGPQGVLAFQGAGALFRHLFPGGPHPAWTAPSAARAPSMGSLGLPSAMPSFAGNGGIPLWGGMGNPFLAGWGLSTMPNGSPVGVAPNAAPGNLALNRAGSGANALATWGLGSMPSGKPAGLPTSSAGDFLNSINWGSIGAPAMNFLGPGGGGGGMPFNYDWAGAAAHLTPPTRIFGPTGATK